MAAAANEDADSRSSQEEFSGEIFEKDKSEERCPAQSSCVRSGVVSEYAEIQRLGFLGLGVAAPGK